MATPPAPTSARVSHAPGTLPSSPNRPNSDVDEIISSLEEPSLGQLSLFKSVFGVGVSLARYIVDDPLWSILAADQWELDCQELWEFGQRQLLVPGPSVPPSSSLAGDSSLLPCTTIMKKWKQLPVDRSSPTAPTVPQVEGASDYRQVVLVLRPPHVPDSELPTLLEVGRLVPADSSHRSVVDQSRSQGYDEIPHRVPQAGSFEQFVPPSKVEGFSGSRIKTPPVLQRSREPLRPYPRPQASLALRAENDHLKTEVEELQMLLAQARGQVSTLTSLLRDTCSLLDLRNQELEASRWSFKEVAGDRAEYYRVLSQFQAIEAELPEPPSEDLLTRFHIAHGEVGFCKEVAKSQKQEICHALALNHDTVTSLFHPSNAPKPPFSLGNLPLSSWEPPDATSRPPQTATGNSIPPQLPTT
ncbi:hypothetical protein EV359DRAFT_83288 [Lentinula novae-zelandiae]|nr:hypothetical protein EV359DRAFT_83288 [Lentinula novae-zelandiae]